MTVSITKTRLITAGIAGVSAGAIQSRPVC